jgi:hypothetical protein
MQLKRELFVWFYRAEFIPTEKSNQILQLCAASRVCSATGIAGVHILLKY